MNNLEDLLGKIKFLGSILGAIVVLLGYLAHICKFLKPLLALIVFLGTIIIPNGLLVWLWLYVAGMNSNRIGETRVFLSLITQLTAAVSVYTFCWGKWLYPKLNPWLKGQLRNTKPSSSRQENKQKREKMPPST